MRVGFTQLTLTEFQTKQDFCGYPMKSVLPLVDFDLGVSMKFRRFCVMTIGVALCSACTTPRYLSGKQAEVYAESFKLSGASANALGWGDEEIQAQTAIVKATQTPSAERGVLLGLMNASDTACEKYMAGLITSSNTLKSVLGVTSFGLSTAATLSSPTRSANILSGVSTFATGTDERLSNTVLGGKSAALIYKSVSAVRRKERNRIWSIFEGGNFGLASSELADYHALCGPTVGINALEEAVDKANTDAPVSGQTEGKALLQQYNVSNKAPLAPAD